MAMNETPHNFRNEKKYRRNMSKFDKLIAAK